MAEMRGTTSFKIILTEALILELLPTCILLNNSLS